MDKTELWLSYEEKLRQQIITFGGMHNAHAHLDRAYTNNPYYWQHYGIDSELAANANPLKVKQKLVGELHNGPAYKTEDLIPRMSFVLEKMIALNTRRVDTLIDATPDIGLVAIDAALEVKEIYKDRIDLSVGPQPIFGFGRKNTPERREIFEEAAKKCDFIGGLPEKDDAPDRIGYDTHIREILKLGIRLHKEVHIHVDQGNNPRENGTETLIEAVRWLGSPVIEGHVGPTVWAIHSISPACYNEHRHNKLMENKKRYNIGLLCCPRASVTMFQDRSIYAPLHNSIARLLDMILYEIPIRIGTDNINDIFISSGHEDMVQELIIAGAALRYEVKLLWAKLACGIMPNDTDRELISRALKQEQKAIKKQ